MKHSKKLVLLMICSFIFANPGYCRGITTVEEINQLAYAKNESGLESKSKKLDKNHTVFIEAEVFIFHKIDLIEDYDCANKEEYRYRKLKNNENTAEAVAHRSGS